MGEFRVVFTDGSAIECQAVEDRDYGVLLRDESGENLGFVPESILEAVEVVDD